MKKLYQTEKWIEYSLKKSESELRRRRKKVLEYERLKRRDEKRKVRVSQAYKNIQKRHGRIEIAPPSNFSLINNIEETGNFFNALNELIDDGKNIFLDLSGVEELSTDALLYILSRLEYNKIRQYKANIFGCAPSNPDCKKIMETSGFLKYVYSQNMSRIESDPDVFSIESGSYVFPQKAAGIKTFIKDKLGKAESQETKSIFKNIIECMANTKHHAYKAHATYSKWWVMGSYIKDSNKVHVTFLDNGYGIPNTIRINFREKVQRMFANVISVGRTDSLLIKSALLGEFRTRTESSYRGKGLPQIYRSAEEGKMSDLIVISRRGYVNSKKAECKELEQVFHGTLLSWNVL